jgi:DNA-directed RNA polymerase II subunit RPB2
MERYERHGDDDLLIGDLLSTGAVEFVTSGDQGVAVAVLPTDLVWPREIKDLVLFGWDSYRNYTHIEIHPVAAAFGSSAALVPYGNCNQAPRVSYHTGMGKHATSLTFLTGRHRTDSSAQQLWEPQVPLVQTFCEEATGSTDLPSVTNLMVLVMCNPFGIEDPYILNRDSAQLGVGICTVTHTVRDEEKARNTDSSCFERPGDNCESRHHVDYGRINVMGFAPPGTVLQPGDPIIGKTIRTEQAGDRAGTAVRDASTYHKDHDSAVVDMVVDTVGRDGERAIKSRYHSVRMAAVGDKYATRHGQKGSVGHMVPATDMPFTASGLTADIIVNPHAYPSRMTPAMHREALAGLCALLDFSVEDATPFTQNEGRDMEILMERLRAHGYHPCAEETFYCGKTGEPLPGTYFYAPISFLKLKQRAADKKHTRSEGPVQVLSRQPVEGRMRDGGFRQGPMEVTCYNTHGAAAVINDRLCKSSDVFPIVVCHKCRLVGEPAHKQWRGPQDGPRTEEHLPYCRACKSHKHTEERPMSYGFKMLLQSMQSMNMCLYLELGPIQHGPPPLLEGMPRDMTVLVDGGVLEDEHGNRWTANSTNNDATAALTPHVGGPTDTPTRMHNMDPPAPRPQKKRRIVVDDDDDSADNASVDITQVDSNQDVGLESMF